jgi:hypothetical protein
VNGSVSEREGGRRTVPQVKVLLLLSSAPSFADGQDVVGDHHVHVLLLTRQIDVDLESLRSR